MGTEVMHPRDILSSQRLGFSPSTDAAAFLPRRRHTPSSCPGSPPNARPHQGPEPRKRREGSPRPAKNSNGSPEMGQVTILRRGGYLDPQAGGGPRARARKMVERRVAEAAARKEVIVSGAALLRPEPAAVPKRVLRAEVRTGAKAAGQGETYAGSAFSLSPSPGALPLPTFPSRRPTAGGGAVVDVLATMVLRRLLRLD